MNNELNINDLFADDGDDTMRKVVRILEESFKCAYRDGFQSAVITEGRLCDPDTAWLDFKARVNADAMRRAA